MGKQPPKIGMSDGKRVDGRKEVFSFAIVGNDGGLNAFDKLKSWCIRHYDNLCDIITVIMDATSIVFPTTDYKQGMVHMVCSTLKIRYIKRCQKNFI